MMPTAAIDLDYTSANLVKQTHPNPIFRAVIAAFNARLLALADTAAPVSVLGVGRGEGFVLKYLAEQRSLWRLAGCDLNAAPSPIRDGSAQHGSSWTTPASIASRRPQPHSIW